MAVAFSARYLLFFVKKQCTVYLPNCRVSARSQTPRQLLANLDLALGRQSRRCQGLQGAYCELRLAVTDPASVPGANRQAALTRVRACASVFSM